jgi:ABC-2 type transport system ATP-binding protein
MRILRRRRPPTWIILHMASATVIRVDGIRKAYGRTVAVDDVSFEVRRGEIFGLIGPNGAGKTTTMECVEGVRTPDRGAVSVLGLDPYKQGRQLQDRIGVQLQAAQLQKRIKVWEAVDLWASLYSRHLNRDDLLHQLGLHDKRNAWFMTLSGGQKQRLFIALALVNDPEVVFLDELTTGLDPQARRAIWDLVRDIRARGKTVFLTTHLMEEAERLCDRVAIIEHGSVIDVDTPAALVRRHCPGRSIVLATEDAAAAAHFRALPSIDAVTSSNGLLTISGRGDDLVAGVLDCLAEHRIRVTDVRTVSPTLEDVFLKLTGHSIRD